MKLQKNNQKKTVVSRIRSNAAKSKHSKNSIKKTDPVTSIRSKSAMISENRETVLFDLLLAAGKILSGTKKEQNERNVDLSLPLFRAIAPSNGKNALTNNGSTRSTKVCHVIPSDDESNINSIKVYESSASVHRPNFTRALHKTIYILDSPSFSDGVHFGHTTNTMMGPTLASQCPLSPADGQDSHCHPIPNRCRPIPPPPRLPRVPAGFAYKSGKIPTTHSP